MAIDLRSSTLLVLLITITTVNCQLQTLIDSTTMNLRACIPDPPQDITYTCTNNDPSNNDINWRIGTYQIVDTNIFRDFGVNIASDGSTLEFVVPTSLPQRSDHGTSFLFNSYNEDPLRVYSVSNPVVTIDCVTVENDLLLRPSVNSITLYKGVPPVEEPDWEVTNCNDDGTLNVSVSYQNIPESDTCVDGNISYIINITYGNNAEEFFDDLMVQANVDINTDIYATMRACVGDICSERRTYLSDISCVQSPVVEVCDDSGSQEAIINCGLLAGASDAWSCRYDGDMIVDVYDATSPLKYMCPDEMPDLPDEPGVPPDDDDDDDDCTTILVVCSIVAFILGLLISLVIFIVIACLVYKSGNKNNEK